MILWVQQLFDSNNYFGMLIEDLVQKISNSIEELARILDQIYKIPARAREKYFDGIQKMKDKLIALKTQAKQSNFASTERNYKQAYLALHKLKQQIGEQLAFSHNNKENRDFNRPSLSETRKQHEEAMKLIVEKDQKIQQLNQALFEKEELVRVTFEQSRRYNKEAQHMTEQYKSTKTALSKLQIEYSSLKSVFIKIEQEKIDFQLKDQQREMCFRSAIEEVEILKEEQLVAQQKIEYFQKLAQVSMRKTKMVEDNFKMVQNQANTLIENYRRQQCENLRRMKQIDELNMQLNQKSEKMIQQEIYADRLKMQVEMLQFELDKLEKYMQEERAINNQLRSKKQTQINHYEDLLYRHRSQQEEMNSKLKLLESNAEQSKQQLNEKSKQLRRIREQLEESKTKVEQYLMMTLNMQNKQEQAEMQLASLKLQKKLQEQQMEKAMQLRRQLENDIKVWKQRLRVKGQQKTMAVQQAQKWQRQVKNLQKDRSVQSKRLQSFQVAAIESKTSIIRLQQVIKQKQREMDMLRARFLRAKIQIIHEMRQQMS